MSIWKYSDDFIPQIENDFQLSVGEGNTPLESFPALATRFNLDNIYLKREDNNPTGSHKDRGLAYHLSYYIKKGYRDFVISSSGNSAISAIRFARKYHLNLDVYLSCKISDSKINRINNITKEDLIHKTNLKPGTEIEFKNIKIHIDKRPKVTAFRFSKENNKPFLRGSTEEHATEGYKSIAFEIYEENPNIDSIFVPTSSGTTAQGIYDGYKMIEKKVSENSTWKFPQIHVVQSTKVNPIARSFDNDFVFEESSLAKSIVDRVAHRKEKLVDSIIQTNGNGWVVDNESIEQGQKILEDLGIKCSEEGGLVIAGLIKSLKNKERIMNPVLLITGTESS